MGQEIRETMEKEIYPFMKELFWRIAEGQDTLHMDGVWVYNEKAQFVGGKVINLCSYVLTELLDQKEKEKGIHALKTIIPMCANLPMQTWGIFNALKGLYRLEQKGIREIIIQQKVWEKLRDVLDWRTFVDCENHLALKGYPTNYYGVAFGIARYRELLGWEEDNYADKLLSRFMEHIHTYSGEYEFMDETPGDGRFDRYSILVPAEIANTVMDTGMELPEKIISMLKKSTAICLFMANRDGYGFSYGRSTGAYGDTGVLEVLTAAHKVKTIMNTDEERLAYAYCTAIMHRFGSFWIDPDMRSVNMWEKGRRTDSYRNKNRILSENLSLCMQLLEAAEWESPCSGKEEMEHLWENREKQPLKGMMVPFAKGEYERALVIVRDGRRIWSLPLISGGKEYFDKSPYLPIPYSQFAVTGVPGEAYPYMVLQITLENDIKLMPIVYFRNLQIQQEENHVMVSGKMDSLCVVGEEKMHPYGDIACEFVYTFSHGKVERRDTFYVEKGEKIKKIEMDILTFSDEKREITGGVEFGKGILRKIMQKGFTHQSVIQIKNQENYCTPEGEFLHQIHWEEEPDQSKGLTVSWEIRYDREEKGREQINKGKEG